MKQKSYFNLFYLAVLLIVFELFTSKIQAQPVRVTMNINYDSWIADESDWYNAIYFSDNLEFMYFSLILRNYVYIRV